MKRVYGPVRFRFSGDVEKARLLTSLARKFAGAVRAESKSRLLGRHQFRRTFRLEDGSVINVVSRFGQYILDIYVPPIEAAVATVEYVYFGSMDTDPTEGVLADGFEKYRKEDYVSTIDSNYITHPLENSTVRNAFHRLYDTIAPGVNTVTNIEVVSSGIEPTTEKNKIYTNGTELTLTGDLLSASQPWYTAMSGINKNGVLYMAVRENVYSAVIYSVNLNTGVTTSAIQTTYSSGGFDDLLVGFAVNSSNSMGVLGVLWNDGTGPFPSNNGHSFNNIVVGTMESGSTLTLIDTLPYNSGDITTQSIQAVAINDDRIAVLVFYRESTVRKSKILIYDYTGTLQDTLYPSTLLTAGLDSQNPMVMTNSYLYVGTNETNEIFYFTITDNSDGSKTYEEGTTALTTIPGSPDVLPGMFTKDSFTQAFRDNNTVVD